MIKNQEWYFIDITMPDGIELSEQEIHDIFMRENYKYRYLIENFIVIDIDNKLDELQYQNLCDSLKEGLENKIKQQIHQGELHIPHGINESDFVIEMMEGFIVDFKVNEEILFEFTIEDNNLNEDILIEKLTRNPEVNISEYDTEAEFLKKTDYAQEFYTLRPLIHNIRCENIATLTLNTIKFEPGIMFIGYMKLGQRIKITLKAFNFIFLNYIIGVFKKNFEKIKFHDNLNWKWLLSRRISAGYREKNRVVVENDTMLGFMHMTKQASKENSIAGTLLKLLNKGYLTEKEFLELPEQGLDKSLISYLQHFKRINKRHIKNDFVWVDPSAGLIFYENNKTDPRRMTEIKSKFVEKIYAPSEHLLFYIRAYWHQEYVKNILQEIKDQWEKDCIGMRILEIRTDLQFDLIRTGDLGQASKDIDVLLRIKNEKIDKEFIVALESKRNSKEFNEMNKDISKKIARNYASIFDGFLGICFFKHTKKQKESWERVSWEGMEADQEKFLITCIDINKISMQEKLKNALLRICDNA